MTQKSIKLQTIASLLALLISLSIFEYSNFDVSIQSLLYNFGSHTWIIDKGNSLLRGVFYSGIKTLLIAAMVFFFAGVCLRRHSRWVANNRAAIFTLLLSVILVPALIGCIKAFSNMPCPKNILLFNGDTAYYKLFQASLSQGERFKCFPAGHAGAGFSLLALVFFAKTKTQQYSIGIAVLLLAWLMGGYKMAIGHHFLSHTIASMLFAWLLILQFAYFSFYTLPQHALRKNRRQALQTQHNSVTAANR